MRGVEKEKKRTPSARYMATCLLLKALQFAVEVTRDTLTESFASRVNDKKCAKVREQVDKISNKFKERLRKIKDNWEQPKKKS
ncbi:MAG: hypothetical protein L0312_24090 [Acidobacteria bacterium]|nr:hypothetical protein [Acidobacteriota bacterium]